MATLKKYNLVGEEVGSLEVPDELLNVKAAPQMVKDYIIAIRENQRQWSASTKGRSEVNHSTKKPHRQKGTGLARQGSLAAPQYKGGGVVFGPKPKFNQHVSINQKEKRLAIQTLLASKIKGERLFVLEDTALINGWEAPKTKKIAGFLKSREIEGRRVLFVGDDKTVSEKHDPFKLSLRNIPKTSFALALNVNGYDLSSSSYVVMTESAVEELVSLYKKNFAPEKGKK